MSFLLKLCVYRFRSTDACSMPVPENIKRLDVRWWWWWQRETSYGRRTRQFVFRKGAYVVRVCHPLTLDYIVSTEKKIYHQWKVTFCLHILVNYTHLGMINLESYQKLFKFIARICSDS